MPLISLSMNRDHLCKGTFISIVLHFYNKSYRLESVVESIYNQKFKYKLFDFSNVELIFVDNNSTDDSVNKITFCQNKYSNLNIHIINEKTQGVSSARKKEWITHPYELTIGVLNLTTSKNIILSQLMLIVT
ncbi:MAG TPA: glycosyltransferase [Arsenophonus sp.]